MEQTFNICLGIGGDSGRYRTFQWSGDRFGKTAESTVRTRRKELLDAGLVKDTGVREKLESGRNAIIWQAAA